MLTQLLQQWARGLARSVAQIFVRTPITPNMLTLFGVVLNLIVGVLLAGGHLLSGGLMLIIASLFDLLDGALAKITDKVSEFGAFLDSAMDRYSEAIVLLGLLLYYYQLPGGTYLMEIVLIYTILFGSMMVSYARARAGALNIRNEGGLMARPERIVLLALGLLLHNWLLLIVLWVLAIGVHVTAIQRIWHVWQVTSGKRPAK